MIVWGSVYYARGLSSLLKIEMTIQNFTYSLKSRSYHYPFEAGREQCSCYRDLKRKANSCMHFFLPFLSIFSFHYFCGCWITQRAALIGGWNSCFGGIMIFIFLILFRLFGFLKNMVKELSLSCAFPFSFLLVCISVLCEFPFLRALFWFLLEHSLFLASLAF